MWQNIIVFLLIAVAGALVIRQFYGWFAGKTSCCGGGCTCKGACPSAGLKPLDATKTGQTPTGPPMCGGNCCGR